MIFKYIANELNTYTPIFYQINLISQRNMSMVIIFIYVSYDITQVFKVNCIFTKYLWLTFQSTVIYISSLENFIQLTFSIKSHWLRLLSILLQLLWAARLLIYLLWIHIVCLRTVDWMPCVLLVHRAATKTLPPPQKKCRQFFLAS